MSEPEDTTIVRLTAAQWAAMQALTAGGNTTVEAVELAQMFSQPFVKAPKVIGDATDLIRPWRDLIGRVGRTGAVTITITGPQASGKSLMRNAIKASLDTLNIPVHTIHDRRRIGSPPHYNVLIVDADD